MLNFKNLKLFFFFSSSFHRCRYLTSSQLREGRKTQRRGSSHFSQVIACSRAPVIWTGSHINNVWLALAQRQYELVTDACLCCMCASVCVRMYRCVCYRIAADKAVSVTFTSRLVCMPVRLWEFVLGRFWINFNLTEIMIVHAFDHLITWIYSMCVCVYVS